MKRLLALYVLLIVSNFYAQDTLYLPVIGLGHEKYILKNNGTFVYSSELCGFSFISFGTYKKTNFGYHFDYDTTRCAYPSVAEIKSERINDSIYLFFYNMVDSTRQPCYSVLSIGEKYHPCQTDSIKIPRTSLNSDKLIVGEMSDSLVFKFDTTASELHIYLPPHGLGYNCGVNDVRKLKKTKLGYLHRFNVYDENREKPWKRGTKRVVRHYYQLRQKNDKHNIN